MAYKALKSVNSTEKVFELTNFKELTRGSINLMIEKDKMVGGMGFLNSGSNLKVGVTMIYNVNGIVIYYCNNNHLYTVNNGIRTPLTLSIYKDVPIIKSIMYKGTKSLLIISNGTVEIVGNNSACYAIERGIDYAVVCDQLFIAKEDRVLFFNYYDLFNGELNLTRKHGVIKTKELGKIEKLVVFNDCIYIICECGIYEINGINFSDKTSITKCQTLSVEVKSNSCIDVGNSIVFISKDYICIYKNNSVKRVETSLKYMDYLILSKAVKLDNFYILPLFDVRENREFYYVLDIINLSECFIQKDGYLLADEGWAVDSKSGDLANLTDCNKLRKFLWESEKLDFSSSSQKFLTGISINSCSDLTVEITSDELKKEFTYKKRGKRKFLNMRGQDFRVKLIGEDFGFSVNGIKFYYNEAGR